MRRCRLCACVLAVALAPCVAGARSNATGGGAQVRSSRRLRFAALLCPRPADTADARTPCAGFPVGRARRQALGRRLLVLAPLRAVGARGARAVCRVRPDRDAVGWAGDDRGGRRDERADPAARQGAHVREHARGHGLLVHGVRDPLAPLCPEPLSADARALCAASTSCSCRCSSTRR